MYQEHPINIRLIDHVVIRVQNLVRMIDFYRDVLGCRLERGPGKNGLAQLRAGDSLIDLVDAEGPLGRQGGGVARTMAATWTTSACKCSRGTPTRLVTISRNTMSRSAMLLRVTVRLAAAHPCTSKIQRGTESNSRERPIADPCTTPLLGDAATGVSWAGRVEQREYPIRK